MRRARALLVVVAFLFAAFPSHVAAQTAVSAQVSGTVSDATGAVVPGAEVVLLDLATNVTRSQPTNPAGYYVFAAVPPGLYKLTATMSGFRQAVVPELKVDVAKTYTVNFTLEVGAVAEVVEVTAGVGVELQTVDATVGNVIKGEALLRLPTPNRSAVALMTIQPLVMPYRGLNVNDNIGGQVAGARSDQSTFSVDGADATDNTVGTHPVKPSAIGVEPVIPVPIESVEEFRVSTTNPNATFGRSSGGQFAFVTRRGTNAIHGSAYWYHQNDNTNANTWTRNRNKIKDPELKDNRFGFSAGGPIIKDKTFLFGHYEGRRFPRSVDVFRIVPTDTLKAGILRFRDAAGNIVSYPLATSTLCGTGTSACDPRSLGLSPVVSAIWNMLPPGNDPSRGDGLNTLGFTSNAAIPEESDFAVARLDHNFSDKWRFDASYRYSTRSALSATQVDIAGILAGNTRGQAAAARSVPVEPRFVAAGVTGQITPRLTNEFRFGWLRDWWWLTAASPFPQVPGAGAALQMAGNSLFGGLVDEPVDVHTQLARQQGVNSKNFQFIDNVTWVKGRHTLQFGGSVRRILLFHFRDDKVVGSLTSLVAEIDDGTAVVIPGTNRPPDCTTTLTTNCLTSGDVTRWNRLYAAATGMIDNVGVMITRDGSLNALPIGTGLTMDTVNYAYEVYLADTWRARPSLTLSYGFYYQVQTAPIEKLGRNTFLIDNATSQILTSKEYLRRRRAAAEAGQIFNPTLAYQPLVDSPRSRVHDIDYNNVGPRVAVAWNPSVRGGGFMGRLLGDRKTVLRGGYGITYDRFNTVQTVVIPLLGVGFAQTINCRGPRSIPSFSCANANDPSNAFRVGVDGSAPIPTVPTVTSPVVPSVPFGELLSFQMDPDMKPGKQHGIDLTIQRELPGQMLLEVGYVGRLGRNLNQNVQISAVPYFMKDPATGQTFAQAFDAVATQIRSGVAAGSVTPQPWFENRIGAGGTVTMATIETASFRDGQVSNLWLTMQFFLAQPILNLQVLDLWMRTDGGRANYHAGFFTLRKRPSHGLTFDINYTYSKSLDQAGLIQNFIGTYSSAYDPDIDYGPSFFDRRHVLNSFWNYDLPFGRGRRWSAGNWLDRVIGGWYYNGIFTANSGLPLTFAQTNQVWGGDPLNFSVAAGMLPTGDFRPKTTVNTPVAGSGGIGTSGNPAAGGSGLNIFADPAVVFNSFRKIRISEDGRSGRGLIRGLKRWNADFSLGKKTTITESVSIVLAFDFLNVFNRVEFDDLRAAMLSALTPAEFGVINAQFNNPRFVQFGIRVEF